MFNSIIREPIFNFFLASAAIFIVYGATLKAEPESIVLSAETRTALIENFEAMVGRTATPEEKRSLVRDHVADELLFREAIERGMHLTDSQMRAHLANALRRLYIGAQPEAAQETLLDFYAENIETYRSEPTISFRHVFFSSERSAPENALAMLRKGEAVVGDPYWMGPTFDTYGLSMIRGIFGNTFLKRLEALREGVWSGPLKTSRGTHFVFKEGSARGDIVPFAKIQDQIAQDYAQAQSKGQLDRLINRLSAKYDVVVAPPLEEQS